MTALNAASRKTGVLFLSSAEHPGADTFIHTLIMRNLDRSRFDVHVACSAGPPNARTPAYQVLVTIPDLHLRPANFGPSLSARSPFDKGIQLLGGAATLASFIGLARYVRRHQISVLHSTDRPRDAVACAMVGKLSGAKSIIHAHLKCADWMGRPLRWAMGQVDGLISISQFVSRSLVDNGYSSARTHVVLNAIDLPAWNERLDPAPVRRALGISLDAPVISCAARLFRGKGQDDLLRALPAVRSEFPNVRVLIIGSDDRGAMRTSFMAELKGLVAQLGIADSVIFTGQRSDMSALMAASDVFSLPSLEEPFGLVFLEAMAMKKPVVALDSGGAPEVVEHGRSGLLSPRGDLNALSANLLTLLRDPTLRSRMGEHGRQRVEARFTADRMAEDTAKVYESVLASGRVDAAALAGDFGS